MSIIIIVHNAICKPSPLKATFRQICFVNLTELSLVCDDELFCWQCFIKSRVYDQNGVSLQWYIVEIHHSGQKPSKYNGSSKLNSTPGYCRIWDFCGTFILPVVPFSKQMSLCQTTLVISCTCFFHTPVKLYSYHCNVYPASKNWNQQQPPVLFLTLLMLSVASYPVGHSLQKARGLT